MIYTRKFFGLVAVFFTLAIAAPLTSNSKPEDTNELQIQLIQMQQQMADIETKLKTFEEKAAAAPSSGSAGYAGGFFIKSADENFLLKIKGGIAIRYFVGIGQESKDVHTMGGTPSLSFSGNAVTPKLAYSLSLAPAGKTLVQGFDLVYTFNDHIALGAGYNSLALSLGLLGGGNQFITASMAAARYGTDSVGIGFTGEILSGLSYSVGLQNGRGNGLAVNSNKALSYFGELYWEPTGAFGAGAIGDAKHSEKLLTKLEIGGNYSNEEVDPEQRIIQGSVGGGLKFRGFNFYNQAFTLLTDPDDFTQQQIDIGYSAQMGYYVIKNKLEIAVRYSALFDDLNNADINYESATSSGLYSPGDVDGDSNDEHSYSFALAYNWKTTALRSALEYTYWYDGKVGQDVVNHFIGVTTKASF